MGEWIGEMGGFTAIALIAALAVRFLHEIGVWKDPARIRHLAASALFCALAGIGYLTLGGFYHKFFRADVSAWNIQAVWGLNSFAMYLCFLATIAGAVMLEAAVPGASRAVLLPFAFYLYVRPAAALVFCAVCALGFALLRGRGLPPLRGGVPWLAGALCVLNAFLLFACL